MKKITVMLTLLLLLSSAAMTQVPAPDDYQDFVPIIPKTLPKGMSLYAEKVYGDAYFTIYANLIEFKVAAYVQERASEKDIEAWKGIETLDRLPTADELNETNKDFLFFMEHSKITRIGEQTFMHIDIPANTVLPDGQSPFWFDTHFFVTVYKGTRIGVITANISEEETREMMKGFINDLK